MYKDDDQARTERANALIEEIGQLERKKVEQVATEQRLEAARAELLTLQATQTISPPTPPSEKPPGIAAHLLVFAGTAGAGFLGYILLAG